MIGTAPKVFISYSHDTIAHQERVLDLADRLRADGIDAEIDQYRSAPREGWPLWCERQIAAADFVLMVCTETYHRRVSGDEEQGKGLGVVLEARIIRQLLYDAGAVSDKFVPVLFSDASPEHIPTPIKGWTRYVVDSKDGYEELYRHLTSQPRVPRPELGEVRELPARQRQWTKDRMQAATASPDLRIRPPVGRKQEAERESGGRSGGVNTVQTCAARIFDEIAHLLRNEAREQSNTHVRIARDSIELNFITPQQTSVSLLIWRKGLSIYIGKKSILRRLATSLYYNYRIPLSKDELMADRVLCVSEYNGSLRIAGYRSGFFRAGTNYKTVEEGVQFILEAIYGYTAST